MAKANKNDEGVTIKAKAVDPASLYRVTDPDHPCYSPRIHEVPDQEFIDSLKLYGVGEAVNAKHYVINGVQRLCIVSGRRRHRGWLMALEQLDAAGQEYPGAPGTAAAQGLISYILRDDWTDAEVREWIIHENAQRKDDSLRQKIELARNFLKDTQKEAVKAKQKYDDASTKQKFCKARGITLATLDRWLLVERLPAATREAVLREEVPIEAVDVLLRTEETKHKNVLEKVKSIPALDEVSDARVRSRKITAATSDVPQTADAPDGAPRSRANRPSAVDASGEKKLYAPRAAKLQRGIDLALERLDEIKKSDADWEQAFKQLEAKVLRPLLKFVTGEDLSWITDKKPPPKVAATKDGQKTASADAKAKALETKIADAEADAVKRAHDNQRAGRVNVKSHYGKAAFDQHVMEILSDGVGWSTADLAIKVHGSPTQVRASLSRLIEDKEVITEGKGKAQRYFAVEKSDGAAQTDGSKEDDDDDDKYEPQLRIALDSDDDENDDLDDESGEIELHTIDDL